MRTSLVQIVTQMEAGGAQRCAIENARVYLSDGLPVETWFLYRKRGAFEDEAAVVCLMDHPPAGIVDYLRIFVRLWCRLCKTRPRTVITYSHYANVFGCLFAALSGVPNRCANQTGLPSRIPAMARYLDLLFGTIGIYSAVISNSATTHAALQDRPDGYVRRLQLVPNGVARPPVFPGSRAEARQSFILPGDICVIVTVGRLADVKNHQRLIRAAAGLEGLVLLIAGDGECRTGLEQMISDLGEDNTTRLLGEVMPRDLGRLFAAADAFILPSLWESFGLAPLEAAGAGLPIAVSDIPAMREVAGEPEAGNALFFNPESEEDIRSALTRLRDDRELRARLSRQSLTLADAYSIDAMAEGFLRASGHGG